MTEMDLSGNKSVQCHLIFFIQTTIDQLSNSITRTYSFHNHSKNGFDFISHGIYYIYKSDSIILKM